MQTFGLFHTSSELFGTYPINDPIWGDTSNDHPVLLYCIYVSDDKISSATSVDSIDGSLDESFDDDTGSEEGT